MRKFGRFLGFPGFRVLKSGRLLFWLLGFTRNHPNQGARWFLEVASFRWFPVFFVSAPVLYRRSSGPNYTPPTSLHLVGAARASAGRSLLPTPPPQCMCVAALLATPIAGLLLQRLSSNRQLAGLGAWGGPVHVHTAHVPRWWLLLPSPPPLGCCCSEPPMLPALETAAAAPLLISCRWL